MRAKSRACPLVPLAALAIACPHHRESVWAPHYQPGPTSVMHAHRKDTDIADLRAASADLINLYARFELPRQWGSGEAAAADGTHFETYEDNLLAEHHIRYGKTGGIAYRHIADNYIALFSRFIACGTYEATYILDASLQKISGSCTRNGYTRIHTVSRRRCSVCRTCSV
jgi:TnpA family transposase